MYTDISPDGEFNYERALVYGAVWFFCAKPSRSDMRLFHPQVLGILAGTPDESILFTSGLGAIPTGNETPRQHLAQIETLIRCVSPQNFGALCYELLRLMGLPVPYSATAAEVAQ